MARWGHFRYGQAHYDEPENPTVKIKATHMRDLHIWPTNPFDDPAISITNLVTFAADNILRMTKTNPNDLFTARIAATAAALGTVNTTFQLDQEKLGERKTANQAKAAFRQTLTESVGKIQIALQQKYGKNAPQLATYFPNGLSAFNKTRDEQMENALTALKDELTKNQTDVGVQVVADATALLAGWQAVHSPSSDAAGDKDASKGAKNAARAALQLELFKNLLLIASTYPRQPEMVDVYMQQSLLQPHTQSTTIPPPAPTPQTSATQGH